MKIRLTLAILSLGASLFCGRPVEGRGLRREQFAAHLQLPRRQLFRVALIRRL